MATPGPNWRLAAASGCVLLLTSACRQEPPDAWLNMSTDSYEPSRLTAATGRLSAWLEVNSPTAALALQPGLEPEAVLARSAEERCRLPAELVDFLHWRNGMRATTDVPLIWYHRFMSLEDSFERRRTYRNPALWVMLPLPDDWFPIFEFDGEFYFTRCQSDDPHAAIWHWSGEDPELRLVFGSLTVMPETAVEWYERGAVWVADRETGALDMNLTQVYAIHAERNPGRTFPYSVPGRTQ